MALIMSASTLGLVCVNASARVAGNFYFTDIVTYLFDTPVNSINIGGVTLIDAESMRYYGFAVNWYPNELRLEISDRFTQTISPQAADGSLLDMGGGVAGTVAGQYYYTDIKTTLNGEEILSYNIGGRTFIAAEEMRNGYGYDVVWDAEALTLRITGPLRIIPPSERVGSLFVIPDMNMLTFLNHPEWVYYRDEVSGILYLFNNVNLNADNIISMSAFPFTGDAEEMYDRLWNFNTAQHRGVVSPVINYVYHEKQPIEVGVRRYTGVQHPFEIHVGLGNFVEILYCNIMYWYAEGMLYTCITSAVSDGRDEVAGVLRGVLGAFLSSNRQNLI
jgi:hypothetical protein